MCQQDEDETKQDGSKTRAETFVDVLLSEALNWTFDRDLLQQVAPAQHESARRRVFGQDVAQLQTV